MTNREVEAAWRYHDDTKHSVARLRRAPHHLDWDNVPLPFKVYPRLDPIGLPRDFRPAQRPALDSIGALDEGVEASPTLDLARLAHLLYFTAGVLRRRQHPGGEVYFRAQACTGNLHHIDLYLVCDDLADLPAGVYHFGPHDFALRRLRAGDYRGLAAAATGGANAVAHAPAVLAYTSTVWRNAWKYQARAYRHCFWDSGTLLANLLAVARSMDLPSQVVLGFVDEELNQLLGLDASKEVTLGLVALGADAGAPPQAPVVAPLALETLPLSRREIDYPAIRAMHIASALTSRAEVTAWRISPRPATTPEMSEKGVRLTPSASCAEAVESVILRRGSTRRFVQEPIGVEKLSTIVRSVSGGLPFDCLSRDETATDLYLLVNAVDGLAAGSYAFDRQHEELALLRAGDFRREAGHLDLGQPLAADAAVNLYWLADLTALLDRFGNRGYRVAQLDAAIRGGLTYLAAFAVGIGATGLTFFDDDVTGFFSPHAAGKSVMFLMAIGIPERRSRAPTRVVTVSNRR